MVHLKKNKHISNTTTIIKSSASYIVRTTSSAILLSGQMEFTNRLNAFYQDALLPELACPSPRLGIGAISTYIPLWTVTNTRSSRT